jgi:hypothetical protein
MEGKECPFGFAHASQSFECGNHCALWDYGAECCCFKTLAYTLHDLHETFKKKFGYEDDE